MVKTLVLTAVLAFLSWGATAAYACDECDQWQWCRHGEYRSRQDDGWRGYYHYNWEHIS
jgi:hypothetical protein